MFPSRARSHPKTPLAHLQFLRQTTLEQTLAYMREALGDDNFELLSRAGSTLSYDGAVDLALTSHPDARQ